tara:strand:+ start:2334 stop:2582 length:249 start_codon:yes stop_codon:yes gene_type:complete
MVSYEIKLGKTNAAREAEIVRIENLLTLPGLTDPERKLFKSRLRKLKFKNFFGLSSNKATEEDFRKKGMFRETKNSLPGDKA